MTNNDSLLDTAIDVLACSFAGALLKLRRNEWLPHGARWARGGVAMTADGTFGGWMAYGNDEHELSCPSSAGSVNARLERECTARCGRISMELTERAERTVTARLAGEAYRRAQFELQLRRSDEQAA